MIIGIDAREGAKSQRAGKGEYVYELVTQLIKSNHLFILFLNCSAPKQWQRTNVRLVVWHLPAPIWQLVMWLYLEFVRPVDVYFSTTSLIIPALVRRVPVVTTIFDFVSFLFPVTHQRQTVILEQLLMRWALHCSRRLLAISEHTKQDAVRLFSIPANKITVTYLAPSLSQPGENINLSGENIILFVGTLEPRKNIVRLVEAFNLIRRDQIPAKLVLGGSWGWQSEEIKVAIKQSPAASDIEVLGYVATNQKASLYNRATVFVFPSLYEGFGLPPLEAMACGTPVITANVSSLPEVVGQAAILVDPKSVSEIYHAIKRVLQDRELQQQLIAAGFKQVEKFNWQITAQNTLAVLVQIGK